MVVSRSALKNRPQPREWRQRSANTPLVLARMYKNSAERESGLFEQIVMPLIKQRNPQARLQAAAAIDELSRLGGELRETLLRRSLRDAL